jgi:hypothetical protein
VARAPSAFPALNVDAIVAPQTPSGGMTRRVAIHDGVDEVWFEAVMDAHIRGELVHPTMQGLAAFDLADLATVPIRDLAPMPFGSIWRTASEDARIRALGEVARSEGEGPWPTTDPSDAAEERYPPTAETAAT